MTHDPIDPAVLAVLSNRRYVGRRLLMWEIVWALAVDASPALVGRALERLADAGLVDAAGCCGQKTYAVVA